jgi:hypothetical protein
MEHPELLAALRSGMITMTDVLAREDEVVKKTKVAAAVKALPGYGPAKAAAVLAQARHPRGAPDRWPWRTATPQTWPKPSATDSSFAVRTGHGVEVMSSDTRWD